MATGGGYSVTSGDTQYDAVAEAIQSDPSSEDSEYDPNLFSKGRVQEETGVKAGQRSCNLPEGKVGNEIVDYTPYLPDELKHDFYEMLILNAETDDDNAITLKECIENNVMFCATIKPNIILLKDFIPINVDGDPLNEAFKRTLYVVLYVTEEFCKNTCHLFQSNSCLKRALTSKEEQWSIIPVHTSPKNLRKYELPLMLDGLRPLNYFSKTFYQDVKNLLEHKSNVILERKATLEEKRQRYINENYKKLTTMRCLSMTKKVMQPILKMSKNLPELPLKDSVFNRESQNRTSVEAQEQCQAVDSNHRSSQQKTKNTSPLQPQQETNQHVSTESSGMKKSYLRPKNYETDYSLAIATDSPSDAETCIWTSEKDVSLEDSNQVGMRSESDCNKSCYSSSVKTSPVEYSSLPEPSDDKAVPENPNTYSHREVSDIVSEDGSHPSINEHIQSVSYNTAPNISVNSSNNFFEASLNNPAREEASQNNPAQEVPRNSSSRRRRSENAPTITEVHIHINHAENVAIGEYSKIVSQLFPRNDDISEDSENENS